MGFVIYFGIALGLALVCSVALGVLSPPIPSPNQSETEATAMWSLVLRACCRLRGFHDDGYLRMRPDWSHEWQCWTCRRVRVHLS